MGLCSLARSLASLPRLLPVCKVCPPTPIIPCGLDSIPHTHASPSFGWWVSCPFCRYYYGHDGSGPQWLADTWMFDTASARWEALVRHESTATPRPHGRMSHTAVIADGLLVLYGGDDGGHRDSDTRGYKSSYLSDVWVRPRPPSIYRWLIVMSVWLIAHALWCAPCGGCRAKTRRPLLSNSVTLPRAIGRRWG